MFLPLSSTYSLLFPLLAAWLLDFFLGDPAWLPHPVVGFGRWIAWWEHRLNRGGHRLFKGALLAVVSITLVFGLTALILAFLSALPRGVLWSSLLSALLIFFCLAGHTLRREVCDVFKALDRSLDDGRRQVARIVGRDTQALSAQEVRTAALETLAENLSDGVVAPLFWFAMLGVPGMMAYKMVNTLDSMIGYRTPRYCRFGTWAARIDDVANYIPARLTALFILLAFRLLRIVGPRLFRSVQAVSFVQCLRFTRRYGSCHASPNSGWPEAALAACLDCRFGGTHDYFGEAVVKPYIGHNPRELATQDMTVSINVCFCAELMAVILAAMCCW